MSIRQEKNLALNGKCLLIGIPLLVSSHIQALDYEVKGIEASLNSQLSLGSSWRLEKPDEKILNDHNVDNGNKNYQNGDAFSQTFNGSNDLKMRYENFGAVVSAKYWYDAALENDKSLDDSNYHELSKFSGARVMDAYVYGEFDILDMPLDVRLGKQVVSWGDSTFISGGLNAINPYDLNALARPGSRLKDAAIPVNMAFANVALSDNLSAEVFYQLEFHETVLQGCGTYFSASDVAAAGCDGLETFAGDAANGLPVAVLKSDDNFVQRPNSDGQFGLAFRYLSEALDTEFGFYAMNIHSRTPTLRNTAGTVDELALMGAKFAELSPAINNGLVTQDQATQAAVLTTVYANSDAGSFHLSYPEDIQLAGLSFATNVATMSVSGEVSHQKGVPLAYNGYLYGGSNLLGEATIAGTALAVTGGDIEAAKAYLAANGSLEQQFYVQQANDHSDGDTFDGFRVFDVSQLQLTAIKIVDHVLNADTLSVVVEAGATHVHGLDDSAGAIEKYEGANLAASHTVSQNSWGYRALVSAQYSNVFAGVSFTPELFISHDVDGVAPISNSGFNEGNKRLGLTLNLDYRSRYNGAISYNRLSGGTNDLTRDRDYASLTMAMQF